MTDRRPDPAALKSAARTAIVMPLGFVLTTVVAGGEHAPVFAAFGSFALLVLVAFGGRTRSRLLAYLALAAVGGLLIALGTVVSEHRLLATATTAAVTFVIFFSGVVNGYLAAARNAAVLILVLPVMIPADPSAIPDRLAGWGIACAVSIPAIFLIWREPWVAELRQGCVAACEALAGLVEAPDDDAAKARAVSAVRDVRRRFLATPHRPTGPTGPAAAVAGLIEELGWAVGLLHRDGPSVGEAAGPDAAKLREACASVLRNSAAALRSRGATVSSGEVDEARHGLVGGFSRQVMDGRLRRGELEVALARVFRLRMLSFSVAETAGFVNVANERKRAPGPLGRRWLRVLGRQREKAGEAERLLAGHIDLRSAWLRNSLRGAAGIALAVFVADLVDAQNAFWVVLGTLSVLRSNAIGTEGSAVSALLGTVAGILVGGAALVVIGEQEALLWVALPLGALFAAYATRAIGFAAGQAGFSMLVMILFNLIAPVGLEIGLVRVEDVAIGCAVSLAVGLLMWPRGARDLVRHSLGEAYDLASKLIANRVDAAIEGREVDRFDQERNDAVAAAGRLDATLRQRLDESFAARVDSEALIVLGACAGRLLRSSHALRMMVLASWYEPVPEEIAGTLGLLNRRVLAWYRACASAIRTGGPLPAPEPAPAPGDDQVVDLVSRAGGRRELHAALTAAWITHSLDYLVYLEGRVAGHADRLFAATAAERNDLQAG
jgi:uncharacterized membrane protein YccC